MSIEEEHAVETYKSLMLYASAGLKFVLLANGAAAIAVLTFLGHFVANGQSPAPDLRWPIGAFVVGVFLGGATTVTAYFTQLTLYNESIGTRSGKEFWSHVVWLRISIVLLLLGILCFGVGAMLGVLTLQHGAA